MAHEQNTSVQFSIQTALDALQRTVAGESEAENLDQRRDHADWDLCWLFSKLIPLLPNDLRADVQTCYDLREQVWSEDYQDLYYAQQKTSPLCLAATDSF